MSNKRNKRFGQHVRHEKSRKSVVITKAMDAFIASLPAERARKEREEEIRKAIAARTSAHAGVWRPWRRLGLSTKHRKRHKPRTVYGNTFWKHSHDV